MSPELSAYFRLGWMRSGAKIEAGRLRNAIAAKDWAEVALAAQKLEALYDEATAAAVEESALRVRA